MTARSVFGNLCPVSETDRWLQFGKYLVEQRERLGIKRREAAKRAKVTEAVWRDLEAGYKNSYSGVRVLPNPSEELLIGVAEALEVEPAELLERVPRVRQQPRRPRKAPLAEDTPLAQKLGRLSERDRRMVEQLVDWLLEDGGT